MIPLENNVFAYFTRFQVVNFPEQQRFGEQVVYLRALVFM
jgi:hypothetical protein